MYLTPFATSRRDPWCRAKSGWGPIVIRRQLAAGRGYSLSRILLRIVCGCFGVCTHTRVWMFRRLYSHACVDVSASVLTRVCGCFGVCTHTREWMFRRLYSHACVDVSASVLTRVCECFGVCTHTRVWMFRHLYSHACVDVSASVLTRVCGCFGICTHTRVWMFRRLYLHACVNVSVHGRVGESRVVELVVPPAPETDQVNEHVPPEPLPVLERQPTGAHHVLPEVTGQRSQARTTSCQRSQVSGHRRQSTGQAGARHVL